MLLRFQHAIANQKPKTFTSWKKLVIRHNTNNKLIRTNLPSKLFSLSWCSAWLFWKLLTSSSSPFLRYSHWWRWFSSMNRHSLDTSLTALWELASKYFWIMSSVELAEIPRKQQVKYNFNLVIQHLRLVGKTSEFSLNT